MGKLKVSREKYKENFAKRLRIAMAVAGENGLGIAKQTGINVASMYDYINGRTTPHAFNIARICIALDCDANDLLGVRKVDK